jgi:acyl-CoA thioesterase-2
MPRSESERPSREEGDVNDQIARPTCFLARMRLDEAGTDRWRCRAEGGGAEQIPRGLLAAQAMVAAGLSTHTRWRWVHSVHVTHLAQGDPARDVEYRVDRLNDTEHTTTRLVRAMQGATALATATVAFQAPRRGIGPTHQDDGPGDLPDPHSLPANVRDVGAGVPVDVRYLDRAPWEPPAGPESANRMWVRFTEEIPDDVLLHSAAIVLAADLLLVEPVAPPPSGEWIDLDTGRGLQAVGLDLSVRFHRGFRADDWVLHDHRSPSIADYRAYSTGRFFSSMGRLVASVTQETALLPIAGPVEGEEGSAGGGCALRRRSVVPTGRKGEP